MESPCFEVLIFFPSENFPYYKSNIKQPSHAMIYLHLLKNAPPHCQKQFRIKYTIFGPLRRF